jgi:hypothetical protein
MEMGLGRGAIDYWLRSGRLRTIHKGVYTVGHSVLSVRGRWMAAVLACGPHAVISHRDGGAVWDLRRSSSPRIDVTAPRSRAGFDGIVLHRVRSLDPRDVTTHDGIPVTTVARTLLDNAEILRPTQLERMIEEAERLRVFDLTEIHHVCERNPGRRGLRPLIACLRTASDVPPHSKSDLELMLVDLCREAGLPAPVLNGWIEGYEVDAHWPGTNVIVELDSWEFHRTRGAFERDHARDLKLKLADYRVIRLTWRQLTAEREQVARSLRALLGSARRRPAPGPDARARASP